MKIEIKKLLKNYDSHCILNIEEMIFESGRIYAVMGPNGSGKTTLLRILSGLIDITSGELLYQGIKSIHRDQVAYMPQKSYMFNTTVLKNLKIGLKDLNIDNKYLLEALDNVGIKELAHRNARHLSGGEAQRVALARVLVLHRDLVLLDEPASATDLAGITRIENYIKKMHKEQKNTIIVTTHSPAQAMRLADEMLFMMHGEIIEKGDPKNLIKKPTTELLETFLKNWRI
ncbi:MAG: ATP-binding cassette domain-containing protein [Eubacteriales bacterium]